jgi:amino acid transporter
MGSPHFLRASSGLVKSATLFDVIIYNLGLISIGIGIYFGQRIIPEYYSSSNVYLSIAFAFILMACVVLAFSSWARLIPRSGGIYIFLSRSGMPGLGFALSFMEVFSWIFYAALAAHMIYRYILLLFLKLSFPRLDLAFLESGAMELVIAASLIWLAAASLIVGRRSFFTVQRIVFLVAVMGLLALFAVFAGSNAAQGIGGFFPDLATQGALDRTAASAASLGWTRPDATQQWAESLRSSIWFLLPLVGSVFSIAIGGEIRGGGARQLPGMLISLVVAAAAFAAVFFVLDRAMPLITQGAILHLYDSGHGLHSYTQAQPEPNLVLLIFAAGSNGWLSAVAVVGLAAWFWFWIPGVLSYAQRAFLAWSLDRIVPSQVGQLSSRFGTPALSAALAASATTMALVLIIWSPIVATLVFFVSATIAWTVTLAFGIVFPFIRRSIFDAALGHAATLSERAAFAIRCAIGAIAMAIIGVLLVTDPVAVGDLRSVLIACVILFAVAVTIYFAATLVRKAEGLPLRATFDELPVE